VLKTITRISWVQSIIAYKIYILIILIKKLSSWKTINREVIINATSEKKPLIILMWHNQIVGIPYSWGLNKKVYNIVTDHPDGNLSNKIQKKFGFISIQRSSKKPTNILRKLIEVGKNNDCIFITPDAPHGPANQINSNIYNLVKKIDANVIFLSFKTNKKIILKTWDKLRIPMPFSKGFFYWGKIIDYKKFNEEQFNKKIKENLDEGINVVNEHLNL
jgi:lysophospholipid acyltransferase (LPLAT)-like uncharacterized protein|tara:strand:+ start:5263 stop:5916 length:654 start_codon:yes stop_codon:yes gene_type:complete